MWLACELAPLMGLDDVPALLAVLARQWVVRCPTDALVFLGASDQRELVEQLEHAHVKLSPQRRRASLVLVSIEAIDELIACVEAAAACRRLRTHLRERVIPDFHAWARAAQSLERPLLSLDDATIARNRLEFERRCFQAAVLERLLDRLEVAGRVDADQLVAHRVVASDIALGGHLDEFSEALSHGWSTSTRIAQSWCAMTPMRVGRLIAHLGLKGSRAHSRAVLNKARGHDRTVVTHIYSPAAVALIERELSSRGLSRCTCAEDLPLSQDHHTP